LIRRVNRRTITIVDVAREGKVVMKALKWTLVIAAAALTTAFAVRTQTPRAEPYKVVFDLTTDDPADQTAVLRWLREVAAANPESEMEVVMYGRGLGLVMPERSSKLEEAKQAIGSPHVSFKVCEIAMKTQSVTKGQLLPNVMTVPDGIGEIVAKQKQGWGYIKVVAR
jgi:intracellular sulfur oxidation DsrE/DsrF family protein